MSQPSDRPETEADVGPIQGDSGGHFGKYQLFASLGRGGMADVFLAVARGALGAHKLAVVKRLRSNLSSDAGFRRMFVDEARLATRLNHPNVVHTYEVGEEGGDYCIAMEYLEGQPFNRVIRETIRKGILFDQRLAARIIADALSGLQYAHELADYDGTPLQIVHRDISPHNVFVTYSGQVKIVDFGIAKAALNPTETEVGVLKGKVAYMSPEQAIGKSRLDGRSDVFSMGIVLWEALAQKRLMAGDSAASTLHRLINDPIPPISHFRSDVDPELEAIVAKALEKNVALRFQSAREMRDALERFLNAVGNVRSEEVGELVGSLFASTRAEVQGKIQAYMQELRAVANTEELRALNTAALKGAENRSSSTGLLALNSGSGSGVVPNYGMGATMPPRPEEAQEQKKTRTLTILFAVTLTLLGVALAALFVLSRNQTSGGTVSAASESVSSVGPIAQPVKSVVIPSVSTMDSASTPPGSSSTAPAASASTVQVTVGTAAGPGTSGQATQATTRPPPHLTHVAETKEPGFFQVTTLPWTRVSVDGKAIGDIPIRKFKLSPGKHVVRFENEEKNIHHTTTVDIREGETTNLGTLDLKGP